MNSFSSLTAPRWYLLCAQWENPKGFCLHYHSLETNSSQPRQQEPGKPTWQPDETHAMLRVLFLLSPVPIPTHSASEFQAQARCHRAYYWLYPAQPR